MKVEVGPESVTHVRTGQEQLSDVQGRLNHTVFSISILGNIQGSLWKSCWFIL